MENRIKELRQERNMTQEELAVALCVTRQTIIAVENDKYDPTLKLALKIAKFFEAPVESIFRI